MNEDSRKTITDQIKTCLKPSGLQLTNECHEQDLHAVFAKRENTMGSIELGFHAIDGSDLILMIERLGGPVSPDYTDKIIELISWVNDLFITIGRVGLTEGVLVYKYAIPVVDREVNSTNFAEVVKAILDQIAALRDIFLYAASEEWDLGQILLQLMINDEMQDEDASNDGEPEKGKNR